MLDIIISGTYYKENVRFSSWNARQKKDCVYFYDYDSYIGYIIQNMEFSELQRFRLKIYQKYKDLIKFTKFGDIDNNGNKFVGYKLQSPIIRMSTNDFASLLDLQSRKRYFLYDNVREKYYYKSDFINYVNINV